MLRKICPPLALTLALTLALAVTLALPVATAAMAEPLPAAYRISNVAAGDVLNIRAAARADAEIVGSLPPDGRGIEVLALSDDGKWALVPLPEGSGWVARRFLAAEPLPAGDRLPRPLRCSGTEPFWSLQLNTRGGSWRSPEEPETALNIPEEFTAPSGYYALAQDAANGEFRLMVSREICSDGMSDRRYGLAARLFRSTPQDNSLLSGCCTLDAR